MGFVIDTPYGRLAWDGRFDGEPSLVEQAQQVIVEGTRVALTPTGPELTAGARPEARAWATTLAVCELLGVVPVVLDEPDLGDIADVPAGAVS